MQIGGDSLYGQYFKGLIDNVQICTRTWRSARRRSRPTRATAIPSTVGGDTQAPTAPGTLAATAASMTQIDLSWTAATDNVAVTSYLVERCAGVGMLELRANRIVVVYIHDVI